jgi:hypothetical protein
MATLKITITAPLPDDSRVAMTFRHAIEEAVLVALDVEAFKAAKIDSDVETDKLKLKDKAPGERRTRGPGKKQANGAVAEQENVA